MNENILDTIGNTPLVNVHGIYIKLEYLNPSGSVKDRMANHIIKRAEKKGILKKGYTIVEATSGNTGIAFSMIAALKGYKMIAVMPKGMSSERIQIMKSYGAKVIHPKHNCFICAIDLTKKYEKRKKYYLPKQFENKWNGEAEAALGREILTFITPDAFVAGVGTGGTIIGVGKAMRKKKTYIVALEPKECAIMTQYGIGKLNYILDHSTCKKHGIEGIGDGILPDIIKRNKKIIDQIITVDTKHAISMTRKLAKLGYHVGPSSGANLVAALHLKKKYKNVATLFPDRGDRYLSEKIF